MPEHKTRREVEAEVDRLITAAIEPHYPPMRAVLNRLEPLEAIALLGTLAAEVLDRFPPGERTQIALAWSQTIHESVRDGLVAREGQG